MFSKKSRYKKVPIVNWQDSQGQRVTLKGIRPHVPLEGVYEHTIEDVDRLDHLAFKYYKQTEKWWRICDAEPKILWPLELLGKGGREVYTYRLDETGPEASLPWSQLIENIRNTTGVETVLLKNEVSYITQEENLSGNLVDVTRESMVYILWVRHNTNILHQDEISQAIEDLGFGFTVPIHQTRIGQQINIPRSAS